MKENEKIFEKHRTDETAIVWLAGKKLLSPANNKNRPGRIINPADKMRQQTAFFAYIKWYAVDGSTSLLI
jgi:hypothetical protein